MMSDQDIAEALESLLRQTNPSSTTFTSFNSVVHDLESKLGLDPHSQARFHPKPDPPPPPPPLHHHHHPLLKPIFSSTKTLISTKPLLSPPTSSVFDHRRRRRPNPLPPLLLTLPLPKPPKRGHCRHPALPRTEIVKQLWFYIRKNNLQDPSNKRKIICNDELRLVFETDCTDMFKMNKLLAKHIITLEPTKPVGRNSKKPKVEVESETKNAESEPASGRDMI
ncbi:Upstream activation factor subunit UAF30 [Camellia lanceoleosa]|uniref:Upstream activation factor subunit UAF30 n=1 Tax=Camellia lanceoleosa TaxID=1840588 RepID=A0ACC0HAK5_9ERIC|nr:Upstream activation factor subunit UAF30 [Camellia lanceoleosa]